jgi:beta-glucosidase
LLLKTNLNKLSLCLLVALGVSACDQTNPSAVTTKVVNEKPAEPTKPVNSKNELIHPAEWPKQNSPFVRDAEMEQQIAELLGRMTLEEKVGQIIQPDIASVTPEQVREYNLGSVLNGGGSSPDGNLRGTPESWLELADKFWDASTDTSDGGVGIPAIWGTDAVHGHSNIVGATLFPHNIGLGAARDPELLYKIGQVTALEMLTTGLDWTFAPTIAVARNDRWGRTYESYSENPELVASYAPKIIEGIQGKVGTDEFLGEGHMIATAKHFVGDGGTVDGKDQGENQDTEAQLRDIHAAGYPAAIAAGVQTVMASYNSFHGRKMHGYDQMLTDVLVGQMGLDGFVVGDWNGHGQVAGCNAESCPQSFNAGLDMFMAPDSWQGLYENTLEQVKSGVISEQRLDEAVARILRVKMRMGLFNAVKPSLRPHAGEFDLLGAPEHRAIAREAVRKSLVLLKNSSGLLPLPANSKVLVAGNGADDIGKQSGGWTLSWQGTDNVNANFPNGTSIYAGLSEALTANGGEAVLSVDGSWDEKPDVAIVVFGEDPYAETQGDRANVDYAPDDGLELLQAFAEAGIPTISVFISGRPLWVNPEINASTAFVAAWLPGSEGAGIADVLIAAADGSPNYDFTGALSFSWPANANQADVNVGDADYNPQFAYGYGLSYAAPAEVKQLPEESGLDENAAVDTLMIVTYGDPAGAWRMRVQDDRGNSMANNSRGSSPSGKVVVVPADNKIQEDTFIATWSGPGSLIISGQSVDFGSQLDDGYVLELNYQVLAAGSGSASLAMGQGAAAQGEVDMGEQFASKAGQGWQTSKIKLSCFAEQGADMTAITEPLVIIGDAGLELQVSSARLVATSDQADCSL